VFFCCFFTGLDAYKNTMSSHHNQNKLSTPKTTSFFSLALLKLNDTVLVAEYKTFLNVTR